MDLDKAIQGRKSVTKFSLKKPDWRDILEAVDAARYAPMAGNNYSLRFILVDKKELIEKLAEACQQPFVSTVQYVVVAFSDPEKTLNLFEERGQKYVQGQAGAAIENFLLKIHDKGLSSCWVGHFVDYLVKDLLKVPGNFQVEAILPVGYEQKPEVPRKRKIDLNRITFFNQYNDGTRGKRMKDLKIVDA